MGVGLGACGGSDDNPASPGDEPTNSASSADGSDGSSATNAGDGSENDAATTIEGDSSSSLTKAQFIKQANTICLETTGDVLGPIERYMGSHSDSGLSKNELTADAIQQAVLPKFEKLIEEIEALGVPAGDEQQIQGFLDALQQGIDTLNQSDELDLFTDLDEAFTSAKIKAEDYGLVSCL